MSPLAVHFLRQVNCRYGQVRWAGLRCRNSQCSGHFASPSSVSQLWDDESADLCRTYFAELSWVVPTDGIELVSVIGIGSRDPLNSCGC